MENLGHFLQILLHKCLSGTEFLEKFSEFLAKFLENIEFLTDFDAEFLKNFGKKSLSDHAVNGWF